MKTQTILATLFISGLVFGLTACSKQDAKDNTGKAADAADKAVTAVKETTDKAVDATKDAAKKTGDTVAEKTKETTEAVKAAATTASADIMAALENARKLVTDGKWQEAAKVLEPLGNLKLTPEQQSLLDQLKKQIAQLQAGSQKVTEGATKAVGDLLKK